MKYYYWIAILSFFFGFTLVQASEECSDYSQTESKEETTDVNTDVPKGMNGSVIIVRSPDGKETACPIEKCKVVFRKQQFVVNKTIVAIERTCKTTDRHRVSGLLGYGPKGGLNRDNSNAPNQVNVESRIGIVGGAQYQYKSDIKVFGLPLSGGVQLQDNKLPSAIVGVDF